MKVSTIFFKTMKFVWMKLALYMSVFLASLVILGICAGIAKLVNKQLVTWLVMVIWLGLTVLIAYLMNHYFGYMLKAGHIAVVAVAVDTGRIPDDQFQTGKQMVKERFLASNVYFAIDSLTYGAVKQLQKGLDVVDEWLNKIPLVSNLIYIAQLFIGIALGYIDECCLGYTFLHKEQNAYKCAADAVVIYFQNWKELMKNALKVSLFVALSVFLMGIILFALIAGLFIFFEWHLLMAIVLAFSIALMIRMSFIDSYMMISTMVSFGAVAPQTVITLDLYGKISKLSKKYKTLFDKGEAAASGTLR